MERLESRTLFSAVGPWRGLPIQLDPLPAALADVPEWASAEIDSTIATVATAAESAGSGGATAGIARLPLSSVPSLRSLPGARVTLYLDFDGDRRSSWGGYRAVTTPAFSQDSDPTTFTSAELEAIRRIWQSVAEDFAPFRVNVTTARPANLAAGVAVQAIIGGAGAWTGGRYGGMAYVGSFTAGPNAVYVYSDNLAHGNVRYTADAITHESGHSFGLLHQSEYSGGVKTREYAVGPGDGRAPLMGSSYTATRSLWWNGVSSQNAAARQDDMVRLASVLGMRGDDYANNAAEAMPLATAGAKVRGEGIITSPGDADYFVFRTGAGAVTLSVQPAAVGANLDVRFELRDATGRVVALADPAKNLGATISARVAAGRYRLVVASHGGYGDVGQYVVSGTIVAPTQELPSPTGLTVIAAASTRIDLAWRDVAGESGYAIERSRDGVTWTEIATVAANVTRYANTGLSGATTYRYRVRALFGLDASEPGAAVSATTPTPPPPPTAPAALRATAVSTTHVDLRWDQQARYASTYLVERSGNGGRTWTTLARPAAGATSYADHTVAARHSYRYRIRAANETGLSAARFAFARTPSVSADFFQAAIAGDTPLEGSAEAAGFARQANPARDATISGRAGTVAAARVWSDLSWIDSLGRRRGGETVVSHPF